MRAIIAAPWNGIAVITTHLVAAVAAST